MNDNEEIKIIIASYDANLLTLASEAIIQTVRKTGAVLKGPIPLPNSIKKFTVIKGPHVNKDSREQFEIKSSKRLLIIYPTPQTVDSLMKINLSSGVDIKIIINGVKN